MNWRVLKDGKTMLGFIVSIWSGVFATIAAAYSNEYWIGLFVVSLITMSASVYRADKIYKRNVG
ncbi:hypothetical protein [Halobacillus sp. Marseille-Q1614]|uniref:hypothetical protein n=1 Tax=Halobacillus sp. Marseille-Q1614 TaxID=2709134 RepID=UPI00157125A1|nr:hypothetical protein [Halobacillus sp. Marseille-Q1614]